MSTHTHPGQHKAGGSTWADRFNRRQLLRGAVAGAVATMFPFASLFEAGSAPAEAKTSSDLLAFSAMHTFDDTFGLYVAHLHGSAIHRIHDDPQAEQGSPSWSPDGRSLLYTSSLHTGSSSVTSIYRLDMAGGTPIQLVRGSGTATAEWLDNGQHILYAYSSGSAGSVRWYLADRDGRQRQRLFGQAEVVNASAAPDGLLFAVITREQKKGILLMDRDGQIQQEEATEFPGITTIAWSPDGEALAFGGVEGADDHDVGAYVLQRATGRITRLGALAFEADLFWSPDSRHVAFAGERTPSNVNVLFVADRDGAHVRAITELNAGDSSGEIDLGAPTWASDGSRLAINTYGSNAYEINDDTGAFEIDIYTLNGVLTRRLTFAATPFFLIYDLAWQPHVT